MTQLDSKPGRLTMLSGLLAVTCLLYASASASAASLEVFIRHSFDGEPLLLDSLRYRNAVDEILSVSRLSYLLSGFALERDDGSWLDLPGQYAWIDAAKRRTFVHFDGVPSGAYRGLRFTIGLDAAANAADPAKFGSDHPLNPNLNGLHWNWQGGYIFLAMEGHYRKGPEEAKGFSYHLARNPNRTPITVAARIDLTQDARLQIDFNLARLLNGPRSADFSPLQRPNPEGAPQFQESDGNRPVKRTEVRAPFSQIRHALSFEK